MVFGHQDRHSAERSIGLKSCFFVATSIKRRITYNRSVSSIDQWSNVKRSYGRGLRNKAGLFQRWRRCEDVDKAFRIESIDYRRLASDE